MKRLLVLLLIINSTVFAQQGQWTWMNGSNLSSQPATYGTQSVFAPTNTPAGSYEACQWTDHQGYFWLFAGLNTNGDDLWKFDPAINQWAWIKGPGIGNQQGIYGTILVPAATNNPGGRGFGEITWTDNNNDLWMYGGYGLATTNTVAMLGDLWKYNIVSNEWTWMSGTNVIATVPVYGTKGVPAPGNTPGGRCEANASWVDANNNLWLYGGDLNFSPGADMWMYNTTINQWAWMSGSSVSNVAPVYGTKGVPDTANFPGGRFCYTSWKSCDEDFWMFGGSGHNDMWRYHPPTNEWTWVSGSNTNVDPGHIGTSCIPDTGNLPAGRTENRACWALGDNLINFGGGFGDLWAFNTNTLQWTCMSGNANATTPVNYGTILVSSPTNAPGNRNGSLGYKDNLGNLWLFGGINGSTMNDMWKFVPDTTCPVFSGSGGPVTSAFHGNPLNGCVPLTVNFTNTSINGTTYLWNFGDNGTSTLMNPTHTYTDTGTFSVTLIAISNSSCGTSVDTTVLINYIHVTPSASIVFTVDSIEGCSPFTVHFQDSAIGVTGYSWSFGDNGTSSIPNPIHTYNNAGSYTITLIGYAANGCNDTASLSSILVDTLPIVNTAFAANPLSGCNPLTVNFSNTSTQNINYIWKFGDSSGDTSYNPTHTYTASGTYSVTLITIDSALCGTVRDTLIQTNYITVNTPAIAAFSPDTSLGCVPFDVHFTNTSTNATGYGWSFGDGNTSLASSPNNTYHTAGTYTVTLIAVGAGGCNDTVQQSFISVINPPVITSAFVADTLHGCSPLTVNFTNGSSGGTSYSWSFGDTTYSNSQNPSHTYQDSGVFTVILHTICDTSICGVYEDSTVRNAYIAIAVPVAITANFTANPMSGCTPLIVDITNSSINGTDYYWDFGNSFHSTAEFPNSITYPDAGTFNITLITYHADSRCYNAPDTMSIAITVDVCDLSVPNVFSPNGDGKNEFFHVVADGYSDYHLLIFNRWGLKVFESKDHNILWNGKVNNTGNDAPDGTYYYIFTAIDYYKMPYQEHGFLTLIR